MAEVNSVSMGDPKYNREYLGTLVNTEARVEAAVRCSIILHAGYDSLRLNAYLLYLGEAKLPEDYELVVINDQDMELDEGRLSASLPVLKVLNTGRVLRQEQLFDMGAMATKGKYLLFVRKLINFDKLILEESINDLEASGEKESVSANGNFVLVERFHYASVGGFGRLFCSFNLVTAQGVEQSNGAAVARVETTDGVVTARSTGRSSEAGTTNGATHEEGSLSKEELTGREWEYKCSLLREPKVESAPVHTDEVNDQIELELKRNNFRVVDLVIETGDYWKYIEAAELYKLKRNYGGYDGPNFPEKSLEHYLAAKLLQLGPDDVYMDVASQCSPAVQIYHKLYGCKTYRQDLSYPVGISGDMVGGDAGAISVPNGFATKMGLHCSFEHFERDSDIRFIREAGRVLQPGGKVCILPLYLSCHYAIQTDPAMLPEGGIEFEPDAVLYCARGYRNRHGRFYDVPHFISRVRNALNGLQLTVYSVRNAQEVHPSCYVTFIALLEKRQDTES